MESSSRGTWTLRPIDNCDCAQIGLSTSRAATICVHSMANLWDVNRRPTLSHLYELWSSYRLHSMCLNLSLHTGHWFMPTCHDWAKLKLESESLRALMCALDFYKEVVEKNKAPKLKKSVHWLPYKLNAQNNQFGRHIKWQWWAWNQNTLSG